MKSQLGVINSDIVNKKNMRFPVETLEEALSQRWMEGFPVNIGHDLHKLIAWGKPLGIYLEPGLSRLMGITYYADNQEEWENITEARKYYLNKWQNDLCKPYKDKLIELLPTFLKEKIEFIFTSCASAYKENIVWELFPDLKENLDRDNLLFLDNILTKFNLIGDGYFKDKKSDFVICLSHFFRKSSSRLNNFNQEFLERLFSFKENKNIKIRVAIDPHTIGFAPSYKRAIECEYWRGPKYNDDIDNMKVGVTVHSASDDDYEKLFHNIDKTEIWFKKTEITREFEIEEITTTPIYENGNELYSNRYIHSIYDTTEHNFQHFDGAIKMYTEDEILDRMSKDIKEFGKRSQYFKTFRIDGKLNIIDWKNLVSDYFKQNPLIAEYFNGKTDEIEFQPVVVETNKKDLIFEKCPYSIEDDMGLRMSISYFPKRETDDSLEREIEVFNQLTINGEVINYVECDVLELKKALMSINSDLNIPNDVSRICYEDMYLNLPLIRHGDKNYPKNILQTLEAFNLLVKNLSNRETKHTISFNVTWPTETKEIRLSIYGTAKSINKWFDNFKIAVPLKDELIGEWLKQNREWLEKNFNENIDTPKLGELIHNDGILWINRRITGDEIAFSMDKEGKLIYSIPKKNTELYNAIKKGSIEPTEVWIMLKSKCSKCGRDYFECNHSKYLEEGVVQNVEDAKLIAYFWSNKKA